MTLTESKFKNIIRTTFDRFCGQLSSDETPAEIAKTVLAFLDQGAQKILVQNRKSGKTFEVGYFDAWYRNLSAANPAEHEKHIKSYLIPAESRLLLPYLDELRNAADDMCLDWERAETLLREFLGEDKKRRHTVQRTPQGSQNSSGRLSLTGERDPNVAARRTELRNMIRSGQCPSALTVCIRWDSRGIPVPYRWQLLGISKWQEAIKKCPQNVYKLISVDKLKIKKRST